MEIHEQACQVVALSSSMEWLWRVEKLEVVWFSCRKGSVSILKYARKWACSYNGSDAYNVLPP
jgi:hypothetical protein